VTDEKDKEPESPDEAEPQVKKPERCSVPACLNRAEPGECLCLMHKTGNPI
jgi:hypothetical protein